MLHRTEIQTLNGKIALQANGDFLELSINDTVIKLDFIQANNLRNKITKAIDNYRARIRLRLKDPDTHEL